MKWNSELWQVLSALLKWGILIVGGACLLKYSASIGHFPEGIELGEGIAFYFISAGFLMGYAAYWLGVTTVGAVIMRWPMEWLQRSRRSRPEKVPTYLTANLASMWDVGVLMVAGFAVLIGALLVRGNLLQLWPFVMVAVAQGFFGRMFKWLRISSADHPGLLELWNEFASHPSAVVRFRVSCILDRLPEPLFTVLSGQLARDKSQKVHSMARARVAEVKEHNVT